MRYSRLISEYFKHDRATRQDLPITQQYLKIFQEDALLMKLLCDDVKQIHKPNKDEMKVGYALGSRLFSKQDVLFRLTYEEVKYLKDNGRLQDYLQDQVQKNPILVSSIGDALARAGYESLIDAFHAQIDKGGILQEFSADSGFARDLVKSEKGSLITVSGESLYAFQMYGRLIGSGGHIKQASEQGFLGPVILNGINFFTEGQPIHRVKLKNFAPNETQQVQSIAKQVVGEVMSLAPEDYMEYARKINDVANKDLIFINRTTEEEHRKYKAAKSLQDKKLTLILKNIPMRYILEKVNDKMRDEVKFLIEKNQAVIYDKKNTSEKAKELIIFGDLKRKYEKEIEHYIQSACNEQLPDDKNNNAILHDKIDNEILEDIRKSNYLGDIVINFSLEHEINSINKSADEVQRDVVKKQEQIDFKELEKKKLDERRVDIEQEIAKASQKDKKDLLNKEKEQNEKALGRIDKELKKEQEELLEMKKHEELRREEDWENTRNEEERRKEKEKKTVEDRIKKKEKNITAL